MRLHLKYESFIVSGCATLGREHGSVDVEFGGRTLRLPAIRGGGSIRTFKFCVMLYGHSLWVEVLAFETGRKRSPHEEMMRVYLPGSETVFVTTQNLDQAFRFPE